MMRIMLNGAWREVAMNEPDLGLLLQQLGYGQTVVATALNGEFVPTSARGNTKVCEGDRIEVLAPMQGG